MLEEYIGHGNNCSDTWERRTMTEAQEHRKWNKSGKKY
jgi:hypothetical protein